MVQYIHYNFGFITDLCNTFLQLLNTHKFCFQLFGLSSKHNQYALQSLENMFALSH